MEKLNYCMECQRIFSPAEGCTYCKSSNIKELVKKSPVNIIGSKLKGRVLKISNGKASILFVDNKKNKSIREYDADKIKKIL